MRHAHLDDGSLMLRLEFQQHQRQTKMIVEVAFRLQHAEAGGEHVGDGFFGGGLAGGSGHADQRLAPQAADRGAQGLQSDQRVVDRQQPGLYRIARQLVLADDCGHGALLQRLLHEIVAIHALALHREEKLAGLNGARIDGVSLGDRFVVEFAGGRNEFGDSRKRELHAAFSGGGVGRLAVVSGIAQDLLRDLHIVKRNRPCRA